MRDHVKSAAERAKELVEQMTIEEAASQLRYDAPPIKRLNIPGYNWWGEALHGVARAGTATVFPQAIAMAATFDEELLHKIADAIGTEARAKYNTYSREGDADIYKGLTLWSPNVNLFRDPRWGRGHETYGEDPYLTSRLGVAYIKGLQGDGEVMKAAACVKHFAVHSGPEGLRHSFNAVVNSKDLEESYLPAFEAAVTEAQVEGVMGAYNRVNGEPCCGSKRLMQEILRERWGFDGYYVSDCWAIKDFHENHMVTSTPMESATLALRSGCDLNCGNTYLHLLYALKKQLVTEEEIRQAAVRLFTTRYKLGLFDETEYDHIPYEANDTKEHHDLALETAHKSIVLLKNNGVLPLQMSDDGLYTSCKQRIRKIGIIGPTADSRAVLEGNYFGTASRYVTNLEGITDLVETFDDEVRILYSVGCHLFKDSLSGLSWKNDRISEAVTVTKESDVIILCLGLDATLEGEAGDQGNYFASGDKVDLLLPAPQRLLLETVTTTAKELGKKVIVVVNSGSALDLSYAEEHADAILECWYSGALGGRALVDVLFGKVNPSGRLPVTFYYNRNLPEFTDYSMKGRTYRYLKEEPLYPFGYGLSYTTFAYRDVKLSHDEKLDVDRMSQQGAKLKLELELTVQNTGNMDGEEVVLCYVDKQPDEKLMNGLNDAYIGEKLISENQPIRSLCAFARVFLKAEESGTIQMQIAEHSLTTVLENGERVLLYGSYQFEVGAHHVEFELHGGLSAECPTLYDFKEK